MTPTGDMVIDQTANQVHPGGANLPKKGESVKELSTGTPEISP